ncbi:MAG: 2OG-Fe(II) oxygenase [Gloeomargarita sp. SKYBB_i_bin120]|nr:2OG-Fe(II) oxygenase [Gloeomargarita sp. SKYG98]MCS7292167.1 2OG-Fe(II) oxygenase [Gloeomargarita sp. SKYB120]MDW8177728.1 2OG-Fe(II) oxygenase [Gloeomargarita sp. SKYBB_i_bin120]
MDLIPLGQDILWIPGVIAPDICRHVMTIVEAQELQTAGILLDTVDTQVRSSDILHLGGTQPLLRSTQALLASCLRPVQKLLHRYYGIAFYDMEAIAILRYRPGQFYRRHVDNILLGSRRAELAQGIPTRDIGVVGYLNDDFTGGETYFDRQNITVKPQQGAVVVFPAYYTHPHQALPVRTGVKYVLTTWLFHG